MQKATCRLHAAIFLLLFIFSFNIFAASTDKIDLNFQSLPLDEALTVYADYTNHNLIIDTSINELVDLRLHNVTPDDLLKALVKMYDLVTFTESGITTVMKRNKFETRHNSRLFRVVKLVHLNVDEVFVSLDQRQNSTNLKTKQNNTISINRSTNSIILQGTQSFISRNVEIIKYVDIEQKQIFIDAKLVSITDSDLYNLGLKLRSSVKAGNQIVDGFIDLGVTSTSSYSFLLTKVGKFLLDIELDALKQNGTTKVISQPSLYTSNNKQARITQGIQIPYQVQDENGAFHNEFKDAVLSLTVTPRISFDNVFLDISITKDSPSDVNADTILIDTRTFDSSIRIQSGETIVLGGIKDKEFHKTIYKVPFLSDIPYLGQWLFSSFSETKTNRNLVIFLTPTII